MTSDKYPTGTDRVSEVAEKLSAELYVVIQGDEPLIEPGNISIAIQAMKNQSGAACVILKAPFKNPVDVVNATTPKIECDSNGFALMITRSHIQYPHTLQEFDYYTPLGTYVFTRDGLKLYKSLQKEPVESAEDSEILHFIEHVQRVFVQEVRSETIAVDTKKDLERVKLLLSPLPCWRYA